MWEDAVSLRKELREALHNDAVSLRMEFKEAMWKDAISIFKSTQESMLAGSMVSLVASRESMTHESEAVQEALRESMSNDAMAVRTALWESMKNDAMSFREVLQDSIRDALRGAITNETMRVTNETVLADKIEYCTTDFAKWNHFSISFGCGLILMVILKIMSQKIRNLRKCQHLDNILTNCTIPLLVLGMLSFFYMEGQDLSTLFFCIGNLQREMNCYWLAQGITFVVHSFFLVKTIIHWTQTSYFYLASSLINTMLFIEDLLSICTNQQLLAFQYLFFFNYCCPEARACLRRVAVNKFPAYRITSEILYQLTIVVLLLGGSLRAAEEWDLRDSVHSNLEGTLSPKMSIWNYCYWVITTISTVGYGDLKPTTIAGQVVVVTIIILIAMSWFISTNSEILTTSQPRTSHDPPMKFLVVIGCNNQEQLENFLSAFGKKMPNVEVYVNSKETEFSTVVRRFGLDVLKAMSKKEAVMKICLDHEKDTLFLLRDPEMDAEAADRCNLHLAQTARENSCKSPLYVEMAMMKNQQLIQQVDGWNSKWRDICICQERINAHMLVLSAHSRLAPGIIGATFGKYLFTDNTFKYGSNKFEDAITHIYSSSENLILGAIGNENELIINPKQIKSKWPHILLGTRNQLKDSATRKHPTTWRSNREIQTRPINSSVSVTETENEALAQALTSHPITQTDHQEADAMIYFPTIHSEDYTKAFQEFLVVKSHTKDTRLVSSFEHGYDACGKGNDLCICGTRQIQSLLMCLLVTAYKDWKIFKLWETLIIEDHLEVHELASSTNYKTLFKHYVSQNKIPLGVETVQMCDKSGGFKVPVVNPKSSLELKKGDTVLLIKNSFSFHLDEY